MPTHQENKVKSPKVAAEQQKFVGKPPIPAAKTKRITSSYIKGGQARISIKN